MAFDQTRFFAALISNTYFCTKLVTPCFMSGNEWAWILQTAESLNETALWRTCLFVLSFVTQWTIVPPNATYIFLGATEVVSSVDVRYATV